MAKPTSQWAVVLWIAAAIVAAAHAFYWADYGRTHDAGPLFEVVGGFVRATVFPVALLAGLGALIELVDQIRWNALHPPK